MNVKGNLNDQIGFIPTVKGLQTINNYITGNYSHLMNTKEYFKVDENGYHWCQLWKFAQIFGNISGIGEDIYIKDNSFILKI